MKLNLVYSYWHKNGNRKFKPGKDPWTERAAIEGIRPESIEFCCEDMEWAWDEFIGFGEYHDLYNKNKSVNMSNWHIYPEGSFASYLAIRFCPFCGKPIEIIDNSDQTSHISNETSGENDV